MASAVERRRAPESRPTRRTMITSLALTAPAALPVVAALTTTGLANPASAAAVAGTRQKRQSTAAGATLANAARTVTNEVTDHMSAWDWAGTDATVTGVLRD